MEEGGACEAPEQEFGHATVLDSDLSDREGQVREATENLGEVESLDGGFTQYAGGLVDALLPNEGDKAKLQINVNVPVAAGGAVRASFEFMVQAERDENGIKGRIQIGGGVTATVRGRVFFATVEAFAQAQVYGYMEALGSGGAQMFDHVLLGIQQRIAGVSSNIADAMFSRQQIEEIVGDRREQDYVESGLGASLSAGLGAAVDGKGSSANAGVNGSVGTRLAGDGNGGLQRADVSQITGTLGGSVDPFAVQGSLQGKWTDSQISEVEGKVEGEAMIDADELNEIVMGGRWLSGAIGSVAGLLSGGSGMLQNDDAARRVGGLVSFLRQNSGLSLLAEAASARALSQLRGMGVSLGHKLTVGAKWERDNGMSLDISLERVSRIEFSSEQLAACTVLGTKPA